MTFCSFLLLNGETPTGAALTDLPVSPGADKRLAMQGKHCASASMPLLMHEFVLRFNKNVLKKE
jgi:hypothetical protein